MGLFQEYLVVPVLLRGALFAHPLELAALGEVQQNVGQGLEVVSGPLILAQVRTERGVSGRPDEGLFGRRVVREPPAASVFVLLAQAEVDEVDDVLVRRPDGHILRLEVSVHEAELVVQHLEPIEHLGGDVEDGWLGEAPPALQELRLEVVAQQGHRHDGLVEAAVAEVERLDEAAKALQPAQHVELPLQLARLLLDLQRDDFAAHLVVLDLVDGAEGALGQSRQNGEPLPTPLTPNDPAQRVLVLLFGVVVRVKAGNLKRRRHPSVFRLRYA